MPNRILKESICTSETIDQLTPDEECFFYRIIVNCDDYGRTDARIPVLTSRCYPLKSCDSKRKHVEKMIDSLQNVGLIYLYSDKKYLQVTKWGDHQQIRAARSKYPEPQADDINGYQTISDAPVIQSNRIRESKAIYAEQVTLLPTEHQKLIEQFGEDGAKERIDRLSLYKLSKGKKYASDYATILAWARKEEKAKPTAPKQREPIVFKVTGQNPFFD